MASHKSHQRYSMQEMQTTWKDGRWVGNPSVRRIGMIPTNIPISGELSGFSALGCGGACGPSGVYGAVDPATVDAASQLAITLASSAASAYGSRTKKEPTAKQAKKIARMKKRAAKVKNPTKRDRLMRAALAYEQAVMSGASDSALAMQEANVETMLDAEPEAAETSTLTYVLVGAGTLAVLGGVFGAYRKWGRK